MNITTVGTRRFRIIEVDRSRAYLTAKVRQYPVANGSTRLAEHLARDLRPKVLEYVELLSEASKALSFVWTGCPKMRRRWLCSWLSPYRSTTRRSRRCWKCRTCRRCWRERYLLSLETALLRHGGDAGRRSGDGRGADRLRFPELGICHGGVFYDRIVVALGD